MASILRLGAVPAAALAALVLLSAPVASQGVTPGNFEVRTVAANAGEPLLVPGGSQNWTFSVVRTCSQLEVAIEATVTATIEDRDGLVASDVSTFTFDPTACAAVPTDEQTGSFVLTAPAGTVAGVHQLQLNLTVDSSLDGQAPEPFTFEARVFEPDDGSDGPTRPTKDMPGPAAGLLLALVAVLGLALRRR